MDDVTPSPPADVTSPEWWSTLWSSVGQVFVSAGQSLWQILPLTGIGAGNSPYASSSAFAGNPLLVDLQERPYADAARIAGIEINTLRTRLHRARTRLAAMLDQDPGVQR